jgi:hypothetical protein
MSSLAGQGKSVIPAQYQKMYAELETNLKMADAEISKLPEKNNVPVYAAELLVANCNRGEELLQPDTLAAVRLFLDRFHEMGIKGVTVCIGYPLLLEDYPNSGKYLDFYRQVSEETHKRGMTFLVESGVIFANSPFSQIKYDFSGLTVEKYSAQKKEMTRKIVDVVRPDYLTISQEPDTAARLTGLKALNEPAVSTGVINFVLNGLNRNGVKIGAGAGTWSPTTFVQSYAGSTSVDYISMHIYPVNKQTIQNTLAISDIARRFNKALVIDEAWLYKAEQSELGTDIAGNARIFQRDMYGFFSPLDKEFLELLQKLASRKDIEYVSVFWSSTLFSYLDYKQSYENNSYYQVVSEFNKNAFQNALQEKRSDMGEYLSNKITR